MKTKYESKHRNRGLTLSLLCAGAVAIFVSGCTDTGYYSTYDRNYYPTTYGAYYTPDYYDYSNYPYSYYGPTYSGRYVIRGTRYYDRYYGYNYY
jgi:hypothetical protein